MEKYNVASFNRDHRTMSAPEITLSSKLEIDPNNTLYKYDVRLCKPNCDYIEPKAMHALEHILAEEIRNFLDCVWDMSPMGCMTGMYLSVLNEGDISKIKNAIIKCLEIAAVADEIPAANEIQCGNYKFIDKDEMQRKAKEILEKFI